MTGVVTCSNSKLNSELGQLAPSPLGRPAPHSSHEYLWHRMPTVSYGDMQSDLHLTAAMRSFGIERLLSGMVTGNQHAVTAELRTSATFPMTDPSRHAPNVQNRTVIWILLVLHSEHEFYVYYRKVLYLPQIPDMSLPDD